jgi:hypothetical protein
MVMVLEAAGLFEVHSVYEEVRIHWTWSLFEGE